MTSIWFLVVIAAIFLAVWFYLGRRPSPRARLGPDGTNVREPESFVVHHEGKGQGIDIANTALKERTERLSRDLPGDTHKVHAPVPGRDTVKMEGASPDFSRYGETKVAPGSESKEKVLTEGPPGSRPETPEEPGTPFAKGRRVTDNHRDTELASELHASPWPGTGAKMDRDLAASPRTTRREPGYGLGRTRPGDTDGEGGEGNDDYANLPVEQPEITDEIPDISEGDMPAASRTDRETAGIVPRKGKVVPLRTTHNAEVAEEPHVSRITDWSGLHEGAPLPTAYGEEIVVALVRNPQSLYVYWERAGFGDENPGRIGGEAKRGSRPVLRVYDLTSGAHPGQQGGAVRTIHIAETDDHWFINDGIEPGHRYIVSYERLTPDGTYHLISHSGPVQTPGTTSTAGDWLNRHYGQQPFSGSPPWGK